MERELSSLMDIGAGQILSRKRAVLVMERELYGDNKHEEMDEKAAD